MKRKRRQQPATRHRPSDPRSPTRSKRYRSQGPLGVNRVASRRIMKLYICWLKWGPAASTKRPPLPYTLEAVQVAGASRLRLANPPRRIKFLYRRQTVCLVAATIHRLWQRWGGPGHYILAQWVERFGGFLLSVPRSPTRSKRYRSQGPY